MVNRCADTFESSVCVKGTKVLLGSLGVCKRSFYASFCSFLFHLPNRLLFVTTAPFQSFHF